MIPWNRCDYNLPMENELVWHDEIIIMLVWLPRSTTKQQQHWTKIAGSVMCIVVCESYHVHDTYSRSFAACSHSSLYRFRLDHGRFQCSGGMSQSFFSVESRQRDDNNSDTAQHAFFFSFFQHTTSLTTGSSTPQHNTAGISNGHETNIIRSHHGTHFL